jgi:hypothetical protein
LVDQAEDWRPKPGEHLKSTTLSAVFQSRANNYWIIAVATPVFDRKDHDRFLGVVALTVRTLRFAELTGNAQQVSVLVDLRPGDFTGVILEHPVLERYLRVDTKPPMIRLAADQFPTTPEKMRYYHDPLAADLEGGDYAQRWLARLEPVLVRDHDVGLGVIVQEPYDETIGAPLATLRGGLAWIGLGALAAVLAVLLGMWALALRMLHASTPLRRPTVPGQVSERSATATTPTGTAHAPAEQRRKPSVDDKAPPSTNS